MSPDKGEDWNEFPPFDKAAKLRRDPLPSRCGPWLRSLISPALAARSLFLRSDYPCFPDPTRREFRSSRRSSPRDYRAANLQPTCRETFLVRTRSRKRSEERRVGKSVDLGGRRIIKKKKRRNM